MNYTVLVVEDEYEQRRALIERVNWGGAGFEVIGEAENGVEALDLVESMEPDLIMTDIKMPMISGLELAARVRELRPATQMVILSGYDSFEYAQTAINYNNYPLSAQADFIGGAVGGAGRYSPPDGRAAEHGGCA